MYSTLLLECKDNIATITLNRADKRNAINPAMIADIQSALDAIEKNHATRVVIITGAGKAFCAGMDLDKLAALATQTAAENQEDSRRIAKLLRRIWAFPRPMIAAVNGAAYAGGCGIATLCDFTLAVPEAELRLHRSENRLPSRDRFRLSHAPDRRKAFARSSPYRPHHQRAEAQDFGMVTEVVPSDALMNRAHELAATLIAASPNSLARAKYLLTSAAAASVDQDLERAIMENARIRCTADFKEGVASFLEKRKPVWQSKPEE